jgi:HAD superfamily hydrolase (TIGR01509 family)
MSASDNFVSLQKAGRKFSPPAGPAIGRMKSQRLHSEKLGGRLNFSTEKISAAVFDLDGTLISSERTYLRAWHAAAKECRRDLSRALYLRLIGLNAAATISALASEWKSPAGATRFVEKADQHYSRLVGMRGHTIRPGILPLLDRLVARRFRLAVATSSPRKLAAETLAATGLAKYFDSLVGGDEIQRGKPCPEIYLRAAAHLKTAPTSCVAFEDSNVGLAAATSAGMFTIVVPELINPVKPPTGAWCLLRSHVQALPLFS